MEGSKLRGCAMGLRLAAELLSKTDTKKLAI
jgi:hypothetical protein